MPVPSSPAPEPGNVFWSSRAQQFYQEGRAGSLSRLEGISHLTSRVSHGQVRFYDERGTRVPSPVKLLPQSETTRYVNVTRTATMITSKEAYGKSPENAGYGTVFVYRGLDGRAHVGLEQFRIGSKIDDEVERSRMLARIGHELEIDRNSAEGGSGKMAALLVAFGHYRFQ